MRSSAGWLESKIFRRSVPARKGSVIAGSTTG